MAKSACDVLLPNLCETERGDGLENCLATEYSQCLIGSTARILRLSGGPQAWAQVANGNAAGVKRYARRRLGGRRIIIRLVLSAHIVTVTVGRSGRMARGSMSLVGYAA